MGSQKLTKVKKILKFHESARNFKGWCSENHNTGKQSNLKGAESEVIEFQPVVEWNCCLRSWEGMVSTAGEQSRELASTAPGTGKT